MPRYIWLVLAVLLVIACSLGALFGPSTASWIVEQQQYFHHLLTASLRQNQQDGGSLATGAVLIALSFAYGVFHAVGPGHGKAVLSTYAATQNVPLRRVIVLAAVSALTQAVIAVSLVSVAALVIREGLRWATRTADQWLEPISFAAMTAVGVVMAGRSLWQWRQQRQDTPSSSHHHHHDHDHHHHDHHGDACGCGHAHLPSPSSMATGWRSGLMMAIIVGLRPCSGSLLVLALAYGLGLWATGVAAAFAMALGTGLTLSGLVAIAYGSRNTLLRAVEGQRWSLPSHTVMAILGIFGGIGVAAFGALLLHATLVQPVHPLAF